MLRCCCVGRLQQPCHGKLLVQFQCLFVRSAKRRLELRRPRRFCRELCELAGAALCLGLPQLPAGGGRRVADVVAVLKRGKRASR